MYKKIYLYLFLNIEYKTAYFLHKNTFTIES